MNDVFNPVTIANALHARYPGVRVVSVQMTTNARDEAQQNIRLQAPLERLLECGLVTEAMIRHGRDSRCGAQTTPAGCGFSLVEGNLDRESRPGCVDLTIFTGLSPRTRERLSVSHARSLLRKYTLGPIRT